MYACEVASAAVIHIHVCMHERSSLLLLYTFMYVCMRGGLCCCYTHSCMYACEVASAAVIHIHVCMHVRSPLLLLYTFMYVCM